VLFSRGQLVGGAVISAVDVATEKEAGHPSRPAIAGISLLFGLQQITEGFLWLALTDPGFAHLGRISSTLFLIMARIVWLAMIPLAVVLMQGGGGNRRRQFMLLGMGLPCSPECPLPHREPFRTTHHPAT